MTDCNNYYKWNKETDVTESKWGTKRAFFVEEILTLTPAEKEVLYKEKGNHVMQKVCKLQKSWNIKNLGLY